MAGAGVSTRNKSSSVMKQISQTQHTIDQHRYRIDVLERILKRKDMTNDEREDVEKELQEIRKILTKSESLLKDLHSENRQTASVAGLIFIICLALYCFYSLFTNPN